MEKYTNSTGFTLVELIVVVGILSILSITALYGMTNASYQGKIAQTVVLLRKVESACRQHYADTGQWPPPYTLPNADNPNLNPLVTNVNNLSGWAGPYLSNKPSEHAWKGALRWHVYDPSSDNGDLNNNGNHNEMVIYLDDDAAGGGPLDTGIIPHDALVAIDEALDDGDLATGNVRGDNPMYTEGTCNAACKRAYFNAANNELILLLE